MAQIKHIAIATQDAAKTAQFYKEVFGLVEVEKLDSPNASGYYLTDGNINLAILDFKNDQVTGPEYGKDYDPAPMKPMGGSLEKKNDGEDRLGPLF